MMLSDTLLFEFFRFTVTVGGNIDEIWIQPSHTENESHRNRETLFFYYLTDLFIFLSCYHPTVADYLLTQMIKPIFCIFISFQTGHQLQKGFRNIVPSEPFIGKNVKIQVFYSGRIPTTTSVCLRAEVYGCEIPQGKTFCLSNFNREEMCDFLLPW